MMDNLGTPVTKLNTLLYLIGASLFSGRRKFAVRYVYLKFLG
jgi:hypothetical protein